MASGPITSWEIDGETVETVSDFILGDSKITADGDYSHEIWFTTYQIIYIKFVFRKSHFKAHVQCYVVWHVCAKLLSHVRLFAIPRTAARQAPLSTELSRQECWGGLLRPPPGDLHDPGVKPTSHVPCVGRQVLYNLGSPCFLGILVKEWSFIISVSSTWWVHLTNLHWLPTVDMDSGKCPECKVK